MSWIVAIGNTLADSCLAMCITYAAIRFDDARILAWWLLLLFTGQVTRTGGSTSGKNSSV